MSKTEQNIYVIGQFEGKDPKEVDDCFESPPVEEGEMKDCCTQVNLDEQFFHLQQLKTTKKNKKKEYKQRKKLKQQLEQRSAKIRLAEIIEGMYDGELRFQTEKKDIEKCLIHLAKGDRFHVFLNQAIKLQVNNIQQNLWEYMQSIIEDNNFQNEQENQQFYLLMIQRIYEEYQLLCDSSAEIQKIITLFRRLTLQSQEETYIHELGKSTFNYLIQNDQNFKSLLRICQQHVRNLNHKQTQKVKQICQIVKLHDEYDDDDQLLEKSTSIEEEELQEPKIKKRKRKGKDKQKQFSCKYEDIVNRIDGMNLAVEERTKCNVESSWLHSLQAKINTQL